MSDVRLEARFVAALGRPAPGSGARLRAALAEARAASPGVAVDGETFVGALVERIGRDEDPASALETLHTADVFFALGCARGDGRAIERFERELMARVPAMIARIDSTPEFAREIAQQLRERLLVGKKGEGPRIAGYSGRGPLGAWLRAAAVNAALDAKRRNVEALHQSRDLAEVMLPVVHDPEREIVRARHHQTFQAALDASLAALSAAERNLLRAYFLDGHSIDKLAARFRIHRATAARRVQSLRERLLDDTRRRVMEAMRVTPSEFASLARSLKSELRLSLTRLGASSK